MKVYLAGPISGQSWEGATTWRKQVTSALASFGIIAYSPLRGKDYLQEEKHIDFTYPADYGDTPLSTASGIIGRDYYDVKSSDLIIANLLGAERVSIGTVAEISAAKVYETPVVLVMEPEGNVHEHPFVTHYPAWRVSDISTAITVAVRVLLP